MQIKILILGKTLVSKYKYWLYSDDRYFLYEYWFWKKNLGKAWVGKGNRFRGESTLRSWIFISFPSLVKHGPIFTSSWEVRSQKKLDNCLMSFHIWSCHVPKNVFRFTWCKSRNIGWGWHFIFIPLQRV